MKTLLFIISTLLVVSSCSSTKMEIAAEKRKITAPIDRAEMIEKTRSMLQSSTRLSETQKEKFIHLHSNVIDKVLDINIELRKLKMVFFNHLTNQNYRENKVSELMKQIKKLSNKKLDIMAVSMVDARKILGVELKDVYNNLNGGFGHDFSAHE